MFSCIRIIAVFVCFGIGIGIAPQVVQANNLGKEFLSMFRSNKSQTAQSERTSQTANTPNATSAVSYHRLAIKYAEQNEVGKANANYSLALQNATSRQYAGIAVDYATFLTNRGDLHRAELVLRQAITQFPEDAEFVRMLARCLIRQEKMVEGRRLFLSVGTEAEARAEMAAILQEQGNTGMLVAVEQKWGSARPEATRPVPAMVRPEAVPAVQTDPVLIAATSRPATVARPETVQPAPARVAAATPRLAAAPPLPNAVRAPQPPLSVASRADVAPRNVVAVAATPAIPPVSRSEFFDNRVPIPVPKVTPLPVAIAANPPNLAPALLAQTPIQAEPVRERLALTNPVRLAGTPAPVAPEAEPPKPATTIQPRRHYVVNAGTATGLEALLPGVRPVAAMVER